MAGVSRPDPRPGRVCVPVATVWTSPTAPRDVDADAVRDRPDPGRWASADPGVRSGLHGRLLTQLLLGEPVLVLEERDGWSRVVAPDQPSAADRRGYPGWVRSVHLAGEVGTRPAATSRACVTSRTATCRLADGGHLTLSFGTRLPVAEVAGAVVSLRLPDGGRGEVSSADLAVTAEDRPASFSGADLLADAAVFLGLRYLWGGTSGWGVDCSGLVHLVLRRYGVPLPRDACDQASTALVQDVALDAVRPGDLYFFAAPGERVSHVGFASRPVAEDGTRWMLHAPETGEVVEDTALPAQRLGTLVSAARVLPPRASVTGCGTPPDWPPSSPRGSRR